MNFGKKSLKVFLEEVGSESPAPGGGAAAALTAALGCALTEMTARLNDKRLGRSSGTAEKAAHLKIRLLKMIDADVKAFEKIRKIYKVRHSKPEAWQSGLKDAARAPRDVCEACVAAAALAKKEKSRTGAWLESDRKEALMLLRAAFSAARLNVEINLKDIRDAAFIRDTKRLVAWH